MEAAWNIIWPLIFSAGLVALNEMGDKSQFLAIAFASRMRLSKVFLGITAAVAALNGIAVTVGTLLASVPGWQGVIALISSLLFLVFGLWSLKGEKEEEVSGGGRKKSGRSYGDIVMVFISFFFSEMGDKTQLVTISLAARYPDVPVMIFAGTSLGMIIADGIGIFIGAVANHHLPENALKVISASLFIIFGLVGVRKGIAAVFGIGGLYTAVITAVLGIVTITLGIFIYRKNKTAPELNRR